MIEKIDLTWKIQIFYAIRCERFQPQWKKFQFKDDWRIFEKFTWN